MKEAENILNEPKTRPAGEWYRYYMVSKANTAWQVFPDTEEGQASVAAKGAQFITIPAIWDKPEGQLRHDDLRLDLDHKDNPEKALDEGRRLVAHLAGHYDLDVYGLRYFMSGGKGVHIEIPAWMIGLDPHEHLPKIFKKMVAKWVKELNLKTVDMSLYCMGKGKPFRVANVKRSKGTYKVPVNHEEFMQGNPLDLIHEPREAQAYPHRTVNKELYGLFDIARHDVEKEMQRVRTAPPADLIPLEGEIPDCIQHIIDTCPERSDRVNYNKLALNLCKYFQAAGVNLDQAEKACAGFIDGYPYSDSYSTPAEREEHFRNTWQFVADNQDKDERYQFNCSYILGLGLPGSAFECAGCKIDAGKKAERIFKDVVGNGGAADPDQDVPLIEQDTVCGWEMMDKDPEPIEYAIDGVLPRVGMVQLFGKPGTGKTFLTLDWSMSIADGLSWFDRAVSFPAGVLYLMAEGRGGAPQRLQSWRIERCPTVTKQKHPLRFRFIAGRFTDSEYTEYFKKLLDSSPDFIGVVVIDTLNLNLGGSENSDKDMSDFLTNIREACGPDRLIIIVHHSGKGSQDYSRGHSSLTGAIDADFRLREDPKTEVVWLDQMKSRDGEKMNPMAFELKQIELKENVTSCVLQPASSEKLAVVIEDPRKMGPLQVKISDLIKKAEVFDNVMTEAGIIEELEKDHTRSNIKVSLRDGIEKGLFKVDESNQVENINHKQPRVVG